MQFLRITSDIYIYLNISQFITLPCYHLQSLLITFHCIISTKFSLLVHAITYPVRYSVYFAGFNETASAFIWSGTSGAVISIIAHHSRAAQFLHRPWGTFVTNETRNNRFKVREFFATIKQS